MVIGFKREESFLNSVTKLLLYLQQFIPWTQRSVLSYGSFRENRSYVMMRSNFLSILHIHRSLQAYTKATTFRKFLQLRYLSVIDRKIFFFNLSLMKNLYTHSYIDVIRNKEDF